MPVSPSCTSHANIHLSLEKSINPHLSLGREGIASHLSTVFLADKGPPLTSSLPILSLYTVGELVRQVCQPLIKPWEREKSD